MSCEAEAADSFATFGVDRSESGDAAPVAGSAARFEHQAVSWDELNSGDCDGGDDDSSLSVTNANHIAPMTTTRRRKAEVVVE